MSFRERAKGFRKVSATTVDVSQILTRVPVDALMSATGRCRRTVTNWLNRVTEPSGSDLITAMRNFDEVSEGVLQAIGKQTVTQDQIDKLRRALNQI